jgi:uncharacterized protein (TIGR02145 family)
MRKNTFWIIPFIILGSLLFFATSCEKDEEDDNNNETENTVTDIDGNVYKTVEIGNQIWMAENLKTIHYANGDAIADGTGAGDIYEETDPKYWFAYNDNIDNVNTYGRLYTGYTVVDSRNVCPDGWHVPSYTEWTTLIEFLGGKELAGGKLKETGTIHWASPNTGATNETDFTALPAGARDQENFSSLGSLSNFWSSTEYESPLWAWYSSLRQDNSVMGRSDLPRRFGFSVRCLKD